MSLLDKWLIVKISLVIHLNIFVAKVGRLFHLLTSFFTLRRKIFRGCIFGKFSVQLKVQ